MATLYIGRPGSGKSYQVVEHVILPAIASHRIILTNIPLNIEQLQVKYSTQDLSQQIKIFNNDDYDKEEFWLNIPPGAVCVFDECWRAFPGGLKENNLPIYVREFVAMHRHKVSSDGYSTEIVLITQNLSQIALSIRKQIDATYEAVKLENIGQRNKYRIDIYEGIDQKKKLNQIYGKYKPEIYQYYKSHTQSKSDVFGAVEVKQDIRANIFNNKIILYGLPIAFICIIIGSVYGYRSFNNLVNKSNDVENQKKQDTKTEIVKDIKNKQSNPDVNNIVDPIYEKYNNHILRWVGYIKVPGQSYTMIEDTNKNEGYITTDILQNLGWTYISNNNNNGGMLIKKNMKLYVIRMSKKHENNIASNIMDSVIDNK